MDIWPSEPPHTKTYFGDFDDLDDLDDFDDMSHQATLSPSPIHTLFGLANFSRFTGSAPSNHNTTSSPVDRRRFSHPHNPPQQFRRPSEDMAERSEFQQFPRLQHRASQTLTIDLTDEADSAPVAARDRNRARSQRPPHLGRSDAQALDNIIDLTGDNEVEITYSRQLPLPRPEVVRLQPHAHRHRLPQPAHLPSSPPPLGRHLNRVFSAEHNPLITEMHGRFIVNLPPELEYIRFEPLNNFQAMPGQMDYQHGAFAERKPEHIPPPPAQQGFTRSPTENDVVICPSCEEELVHKKDAEEPIIKKGGKAPSKKEREEHPFWVVKECGHVYCNSCYQNRIPSSKQTSSASFPERLSGKGARKVPFCAVEDCQSEIRGKDKWVGVFL